MKLKSSTYQIILKAVAVILLTGMLVPYGLQAKQLMDFCMTEMNHHEMMNDSHDCCLHNSGEEDTAHKSHHNCESVQICACSVNETPARDQTVIPSTASSAVVHAQTGFNFALTSPDEIIHKDLKPGTNQYNPPLYLLYDTFLN